MAMFIVKSWYGKKNPDDYFDPVTHIATEENFIKFLECGVYDSKYIGYKVQLTNSADYNNGLWIIADANHDSTNTGQTSCYDLISENIFHNTAFDDNTPYQYWRDSIPRAWLNGTFYAGFSDAVKARMINMVYDSNGSVYSDDKIIIPSCTELNFSHSLVEIEGAAYPVFTDTNSRKKYLEGTGNYNTWWTRSRRLSGGDRDIWRVDNDGNIDLNLYSSAFYIAPIMRVH